MTNDQLVTRTLVVELEREIWELMDRSAEIAGQSREEIAEGWLYAFFQFLQQNPPDVVATLFDRVGVSEE